MPVRTRASNGRFESTDKSYIFETPVSVEIPKQWFSITLKGIVLFVVFFPWLMILLRINFYSTITKKVSDFYDDNISCASYCLSLPQNCTMEIDKERGAKNNLF